jgi:glutamate-ammonia-ligase adenylyltransferase
MSPELVLPDMPAPLSALVARRWHALCDGWQSAGRKVPELAPAQAAALARTLAGSDYVAAQLQARPALLAELLASGDLDRVLAAGEMRARVEAQLQDCCDEDALAAALRCARHREMVRIIWRDLAGAADLAENVRDLSDLADACIGGALRRLAGWCERDWGVPTGERSGTAQQLVVIGMGKLGAHELNLSSDIDLIFAYPEEGEVRGGARELSNHEFFTRLGRKLIKALDANTGDGFVFRVDMRLRPWGSSGALACGFEAMESYYEGQGRPWERYALIKARVVAGDIVRGEQLLKALVPFVYRRYIDYSAFESLRELKGMIAREVRRKGMDADVKLGAGGIREVEFVAQAFQLIRGGVDKRLQHRELLPVLDRLAELGLLPAQVRDELLAAYIFLRRTEHRLQAINDAQTQSLPDDGLARLRVAYGMGHADWSSFAEALDAHRQRVHRHFREVISLPDESEEASAGDALSDWLDLWLGQLPESAALELLAPAGAPEVLLAAITEFRSGRAVTHMQRVARERLDRLMPLLLRELASCERPAETLPRVLAVVQAVLRRSAYLVLLCENPGALVELLRLCGASPWIAEEIARFPSLLDELLNTGTLYAPPKLDELRQDLQAQLARLPVDDTEQQMETLRHFKHSHVLKVAASDVMGTLPLMKVSDYLSWIAEAVLQEVVALAWRDLVARHGRPCDAAGQPLETGFAVAAFGKLGGLELSYGSDLDLVFLYDAPPDGSTDGARELANEQFYTRLVQKIINILTTRTLSGDLYEVDMRLRPSGASGLLVSSLEAFRRYEEESAWTWEHQALARARAVAGDPAVMAAFEAVRTAVLARAREPAALAGEVVAMRDKMVAHLSLAADHDASDAEKASLFDVKHDPGGIVDIEFLVQYLVLGWSREYPELARFSDNIRQLERIAAAGLLPAADAGFLHDTYLAYRSLTHRQALARGKARVPAEQYVQQRAGVRALWERVTGKAAPAANNEE